MIHLVYGGGSSGKSAYAESLCVKLKNEYEANRDETVRSEGKQCDKMKLCGEGQYRMTYIATMQVYGEEGKARVSKHRRLRAGKGFDTLECPVDLDRIQASSDVALLECMSNLVANEMFRGEDVVAEDLVVDKVIHDVRSLMEVMPQLVVVSNNIFEDGVDYPESTKAYMRALGRINCWLAGQADCVTEVVVGIPIAVKRP